MKLKRPWHVTCQIYNLRYIKNKNSIISTKMMENLRFLLKIKINQKFRFKKFSTKKYRQFYLKPIKKIMLNRMIRNKIYILSMEPPKKKSISCNKRTKMTICLNNLIFKRKVLINLIAIISEISMKIKVKNLASKVTMNRNSIRMKVNHN